MEERFRDDLKTLVYEAESELLEIRDISDGSIVLNDRTLELPQPRTFGDLDGVQTFVNKVHGYAPVTRAWTPPGPPPKVAPRSIDEHTHYKRRYNVIAVPLDMSTISPVDELDILHEMAHFFNRESDDQRHGTNFIQCYAHLLGTVLHPTWKHLFVHALDQRGVSLS